MGDGTPTSLALRWEAWLHQVGDVGLLVCLCFSSSSNIMHLRVSRRIIVALSPEPVSPFSASAAATGLPPWPSFCCLATMLELLTTWLQLDAALLQAASSRRCRWCR